MKLKNKPITVLPITIIVVVLIVVATIVFVNHKTTSEDNNANNNVKTINWEEMKQEPVETIVELGNVQFKILSDKVIEYNIRECDADKDFLPEDLEPKDSANVEALVKTIEIKTQSSKCEIFMKKVEDEYGALISRYDMRYNCVDGTTEEVKMKEVDEENHIYYYEIPNPSKEFRIAVLKREFIVY